MLVVNILELLRTLRLFKLLTQLLALVYEIVELLDVAVGARMRPASWSFQANTRCIRRERVGYPLTHLTKWK